MASGNNILKGIVRGKTIELEKEPGLPDGQRVSVTVLAETASGEGLRHSFGSWAEDASELDGFPTQIRREYNRGP